MLRDFQETKLPSILFERPVPNCNILSLLNNFLQRLFCSDGYIYVPLKSNRNAHSHALCLSGCLMCTRGMRRTGMQRRTLQENNCCPSLPNGFTAVPTGFVTQSKLAQQDIAFHLLQRNPPTPKQLA